jgi:pimeloyl-ACP methyl ester carboxylesterase
LAQTKFVTVVQEASGASVQLAYTDTGGGGIPLLFYPPLGHSKELLKVFQPYLAETFRCIPWDPPGVGESGIPEAEPYRIRQETETLRLFLDALGLDRVVLFGISRGATAAFTFALKYPERVHGVVAQGAVINSADFANWERSAMQQVQRLMQAERPMLRRAVRYSIAGAVVARFPKLHETLPYLPLTREARERLGDITALAIRSIRNVATDAFDGALDDLMCNVHLESALQTLSVPLYLADGSFSLGRGYRPINTFKRIRAAVPDELLTAKVLLGGHFAALGNAERFAQYVCAWARNHCRDT